MAEPLAPEGFIRLKDAYDIFLYGRLGELPSLEGGYSAEHTAHAILSNEANRIFVKALDQLAYRGNVVSHDGKMFEISGDLFDRAGFSDLLPLHNAIPSGISGPLANYVGGIVCLQQQVFLEWLEHHLSTHLHGEIQNGDLTPIAANERLAAVHFPALHAMPPLENYRADVLREPYWTLPMAVAWIAWRKIDDVVKRFWPYAKQGGHWRESRGPNQTQTGWVWEDTDEPKLSDLMFFEAAETYDDNAPIQFIKESREELWRALQSGEISAIGSEGGRSHQKIASERWASLEIQPVLQGREYVGAGQYGDSEKIYDVRFLSKDLMQLWPNLSPNGNRNLKVQTVSDVASGGQPLRSKPLPPKQAAANEAIEAVFPEGIPTNIAAKTRNKKITDWCKQKSIAIPSDRVIRDVLSARRT
jgi:hypothetical protein